MIHQARTSPYGTHQLLLVALALICLTTLGTAHAQTPTPAARANANATPAAAATRNATPNANANARGTVSNTNTPGNANAADNQNVAGNKNAPGNTNAPGNANAAAGNTNTTTDANNAGTPRADGGASITTKWFGIEGPTWMVLTIVILLLAVVIGALKYVPTLHNLLGPRVKSATGWVVAVLILLVLVFFIGRWFGHSEENFGPPPARATPTSGGANGQANQGAATKSETTTDTTGQGGVGKGEQKPAEQKLAEPTPTPTPYEITVGEVRRADGKEEGGWVVAGLGDAIVVKVNNLGEEIKRQEQAKVAAADRIDTSRLVLFLDDVEMKKLYREGIDLATDEVKFRLRRDDDTKATWNDLLAKPKDPLRTVKVSVGPEGKAAWPAKPEQNFRLRVYYDTALKTCAVLFLLAVVVFVWLARTTNIIRDSQPPEPPPDAPANGKPYRPYSLGRAQVAWWFFIILGSFIFIGLVTWDYNTITTSSLVLLGIGTGTALGSAMVDANKRESVNSALAALKPRQAQLAASIDDLKNKIADVEAKQNASPPMATQDELTALGGWKTDLAAKQAELEQVNVEVADAESARSKPVSEGFVKDVLSDVNGVAFHRFQIVVWTVVLGIVFIVSVWNHLQMPVFDEVVLALMGISAGTYIGFKIPERQTEPSQTSAGGGSA